MEKVYFLLRNNIQTGPFTYQQLLKHSLQATDLIWIEGQSTSWISPDELKLIRSTKNSKFVCAAIAPPVFPSPAKVLHPAPTRVEKVEKLVVRSERNKASFSTETDVQQNYLSSSHKHSALPGENSFELIMHKKGTKKISFDQLAAVAFIALVIATAWYGRHQFFDVKSKTPSSFASPVAFVSEESFAAKKAEPPTVVQIADSLPNTTDVIVERKEHKLNMVPKKMNASSDLKTETLSQTDIQPSIVNTEKPEEIEAKPSLSVQETSKAKLEEPSLSEKKVEAPNPIEEEADDKKKKTFGQAIKGIFRKKKKGEEPSYN